MSWATKTLRGVFLSAWGGGKATLLTMMVALTLATATPAIAANGQPLIMGVLTNSATAVTRLTANIANPALQIINTNTSGTALQLVTNANRPPMVVNSATKVTNLNADKLDGKDSSQLKASCPTGTKPLGGACIETTVRGTANLATASSTCAGIGRRLTTGAELDSFRQQPNTTIGVAGGNEWSGDIIVDAGTGALAMTDAGAYSPLDKNQSAAFRCVVSPS